VLFICETQNHQRGEFSTNWYGVLLHKAFTSYACDTKKGKDHTPLRERRRVLISQS